MTTDSSEGSRILGALPSVDGQRVVRIEDRFETDIQDLWSAITDPVRLGRWYGVVEGDLHVGGQFRASLFASGWEGTKRVETCEPPHRFVIVSKEPDAPNENVIEVTLTADGDHTILVMEHRGVPGNLHAEYGAGDQIHVEDLGEYLAGRGRVDARARFEELIPAYRALLADSSSI
jgi:uncharacterized protein YndB with AHSA1/START domain